VKSLSLLWIQDYLHYVITEKNRDSLGRVSRPQVQGKVGDITIGSRSIYFETHEEANTYSEEVTSIRGLSKDVKSRKPTYVPSTGRELLGVNLLEQTTWEEENQMIQHLQPTPGAVPKARASEYLWFLVQPFSLPI